MEERGSVLGARLSANWEVACVAGQAERILDAATARFAREAPAFATRLADERRNFDRLRRDLSDLADGHHVIDYDGIKRRDDTFPIPPGIATRGDMSSERLVQARLLAESDALGLAARVRERSKAGDAARERFGEIAIKCREILPKLPEKTKESFPDAPALIKKDVSRVLSLVGAVEREASSVARSLCAWAPLARELGGVPACERQATSYYLATWTDHPYDPPPPVAP
jgi:hypothetical protein